MWYKTFLIAAFIVFLVSAESQPRQTKTFTVGGKTHYCVFYVPNGINKPAVVFYVHGAMGSGPNFENETLGDSTAKRENFIAVYPSAADGSGTGVWDDMQGTTNYPFFLAIIDTLDNRYHIDRDRVYMTGFSQGGMISYVAGCSYSDKFAAIAPVSGHTNSNCKLSRPVSVFMTFGTASTEMGLPSSFIADLKVWLQLDSCPNTPTITRPYPASSPQSGVTRISYGPCAQGTYVIADSIQGEGHQWPDSKRLNQSDEVWAFFKQFTLKGPATTVQPQKISMIRNHISLSYTSGIVRLQGVGEKCQISVLDTKGRQVTAAAVTQGQFVFKDKPSGVYLVKVSGNDRSTALRMVIP